MIKQENDLKPYRTFKLTLLQLMTLLCVVGLIGALIV